VGHQSTNRPARESSALPNLIVIGAGKCGTTALHYYLSLHPETSMSRPKELNFFVGDIDPSRVSLVTSPGRVRKPIGNWSKGVDWYANHFSASARVRGEASPVYSSPSFPEVPERMSAVVPEAKLVMMVRDPIERAVSHWLHTRAEGREPKPIEEALADPTSIYLGRSRYGAVLERFLEHYDPSSILVVSQEELLRRRAATVYRVYSFAGLDASFVSPKLVRERNRGESGGGRPAFLRRLENTRLGRYGYRLPDDVRWAIERVTAPRGRKVERPVVEPDLRARLAEQLGEDAARFRELTGRPFSEWSI